MALQALEGVDRLRTRENNYDHGPFYLFFTLDAGFTLNLPKMITDPLRGDDLSRIETHKTTDCHFRSHSQFFCTFFLPMAPDTYTGILTRAIRVRNSSLRLWRKMWITHTVTFDTHKKFEGGEGCGCLL